MRTTWIIAANSSRVRIFETHGRQDRLQEVENFANPAARGGELDIRTDYMGRFRAKGDPSQGHTGEPNVDPIEHETELFSKQVSTYLDKAHEAGRYDALYLIAYPKFLGLMRQNLGKEVQKLVEEEVPKDISRLETREIEEYVRTRLH